MNCRVLSSATISPVSNVFRSGFDDLRRRAIARRGHARNVDVLLVDVLDLEAVTALGSPRRPARNRAWSVLNILAAQSCAAAGAAASRSATAGKPETCVARRILRSSGLPRRPGWPVQSCRLSWRRHPSTAANSARSRQPRPAASRTGRRTHAPIRFRPPKSAQSIASLGIASRAHSMACAKNVNFG